MKVVHFTHVLNLTSILRVGLAPGLATGAKRIWFASTRRAAEWAAGHVSETHDWPEWHLVALYYAVPSWQLCRAGRPGIWWSPYAIEQAPLYLTRLGSTRTKSEKIRWASTRN